MTVSLVSSSFLRYGAVMLQFISQRIKEEVAETFSLSANPRAMLVTRSGVSQTVAKALRARKI